MQPKAGRLLVAELSPPVLRHHGLAAGLKYRVVSRERMSETIPTSERAAPTPVEQLLGVINGLSQSRALAVAAELELADVLAAGPLHVDVLAGKTRTHALSLFRLLRALASLGIFVQVSPRV